MPNYDEVLKTVYLVRHGQSEHNIAPVYQSQDVSLSDEGRNQARLIAERVSDLEIDVLIASPLPRTMETAQIIGKVIGKELITSEILVERITPTAIENKPYEDPAASKLWRDWEAEFYTPGVHTADGENYEDYIGRVDKALELFNNEPGKSLLVVSHGGFIRAIAARVLLGDELTPALMKKFNSTGGIENTGITVLKYRAGFEDDAKWRLWSYNDHSHLTK